MYGLAAALILLGASIANAGVHSDDLGSGTSYRLFFPPLQLSKDAGERVTAIRVTVACGYVTGISRIPGDWWIEMRGPNLS